MDRPRAPLTLGPRGGPALADSPAVAPPLPPGLASRFRLGKPLGAGSFARVDEVTDAAGRRFALKRIRVADDPARAAREAAAYRAVSHPHVLRCLDAGRDGDTVYLVLELAEGTLREPIARGDRAGAWRLLREAARGVAALHAAGLVHRDLKPENILVVGGRARVGDLGLVRGDAMAPLTATGMIFGTPAFMAPEQARGETAGPAGDVFALGRVAQAILRDPPRAGAGPAPDPAGMLHRLATGAVDADLGRAGTASARARAAVAAALQPDAASRPADLDAWADDLGDLGPPDDPGVTLAPRTAGAPDHTARPPGDPTLLTPGPAPGRGHPPRRPPVVPRARRGPGRAALALACLAAAAAGYLGRGLLGPRRPVDPGPRPPAATDLDRLRDALDPVEAAFGRGVLGEVFARVGDPRPGDEDLADWRRARQAARTALAPLAGPLAATGGGLKEDADLYSRTARLYARGLALSAAFKVDAPPLFEPGEGPDLAGALRAGVEVRFVPALDRRAASYEECTAAQGRALAAGGARWQALRTPTQITEFTAKRGGDGRPRRQRRNGLTLYSFGGQQFSNPEAGLLGGASFARAQLTPYERLPPEPRFRAPFEPGPGDLYVALVVRNLRPYWPLEIGLRGADLDAVLAVALPPEPRDPDPSVRRQTAAVLKIDRALVPRRAPELSLVARGIQPLSPTHNSFFLEGAYVTLRETPPPVFAGATRPAPVTP